MSIAFSGNQLYVEGTGPSTTTCNVNLKAIAKGALFIRANFTSATNLPYFFRTANAVGPLYCQYNGSNTPVLTIQTTGGTHNFSKAFTPSTSFMMGIAWDQTLPVQYGYLNGLIGSSTLSGPIANHFPNPIGFGLAGDNSCLIEYQDFMIFSGYTPTQKDFDALIHGDILPTQLNGSSGNAIVWCNLTGPSGANPVFNTVGLTNSGSMVGSNFYALNIVGGSGTSSYSPDNLDYLYDYIVSGYITTSSGSVAFVFSDTNNNYINGPTLLQSPTFNISYPGYNNSLILNNVASSFSNPWLIFFLPSSVPSNATITYSYPEQWVGLKNIFYTSAQTGYLTNNIGKLPFPINQHPNFKVGYNCIGGVEWAYEWYWKNYILRGHPGLAGFTYDGRPTGVFDGTAGSPIVETAGNSVDGRGLPIYTGVWHAIYKDDPAKPTTAAFHTNLQQSNVTRNSTIISGIQYTTLASTMTYANTGGSLFPTMYLYYTTSSNSGCFIQDMLVIPPGNSLDTSDRTAMDQGFLDRLSTISGKFCPTIRAMSSCGINSSVFVTKDFLIPITGFSWARPTYPPDFYPVYIQPYDLNVSPSAYFDPIGWFYPSSISYLHNFNNNNHCCLEAVFDYDISKTVYSSYTVTFNNIIIPSAAALRISASAVNTSFLVSGVNFNGKDGLIVMTSPSSFVWQNGLSSSNNNTTNIYTITQTYPSSTPGCYFSFNQYFGQDDATEPYPPEALIKMSASLSGCSPWINIPHGATDDCVTYLANIAFKGTPSGVPVIVELSNEHWNGIFHQYVYFIALANAMGVGAENAYHIRSKNVHNIFDNVFTSGGRPNHIVRTVGSQWQNPQSSVTSLTNNNIKADMYVVAPYMSQESTPSYLSLISLPNMANMHEVYRHNLWYNNSIINYLTDLNSQLQTYKDTTGYSGIKLGCYEGSITQAIPGTNPSADIYTHDFFYHPEMYNTLLTYFYWLDSWGFDRMAYFTLENTIVSNFLMWYVTTWPGQREGRGDGTDGRAINRFASVDKTSHDLENVSPALLAWKHFTNQNTGILSYNVLPTVIQESPQGITSNTGLTINLSFNKAIIPSSVNMSLFKGASLIPTTNFTDGFVASLTPVSGLSIGSTYTVKVSGLKDTVGISQVGNFAYNFTLQNIGVSSLYPANNSTNVLITTPIYAVFSAPVQVGGASFTLVSGPTGIPGTSFLINNSSTYNYDNTWPLNLNTNYSATISGVTDTNNNVLAPVQWNFQTEFVENGGTTIATGQFYNIFNAAGQQVANIEILLS